MCGASNSTTPIALLRCEAHNLRSCNGRHSTVSRVTAHLSADDFEPHQQSLFEGGGVELLLVQVERLALQPHAPRTDPFALVFVGPVDNVLEQRIYLLRHPVIGDHEIFLVPIGPGAEGLTRYQAVFN